MQRKVILTLGDRGGTGKTTVAKLLWERLRHNPRARAFDADGTTGAFSQIYAVYGDDGAVAVPQPPAGVTPVLLHAEDRDGRDEALRTIMDADADVVLVDMPATSLTVLERAQADWSLFDILDDAGIEVVTVNVVTPYRSSLQNVIRTLRLAPNAHPVVVLNEAFGKRDSFVLWDGSKGQAMLRDRGGIEIVLPALPTRQAVLVDAADLPFGDAAKRELDAIDRAYVDRWLRAVEAAFEPAASVLCLSMAVSA